MQAKTTTPQIGSLAAWLIAVLAVGLLVILFLSFVLEGKTAPQSEVAGASSTRVAYFEFGDNADTLWLADPARPSDREQLFDVAHAAEYGVIPSIAPDGRSLVYTALAPDIEAPGHDSPAGLWLAPVVADAKPQLLAQDVDLLVKPVWSPDGQDVVYRRSNADGYVLAMLPVSGGEERVLGYAGAGALFPIAFSPAGGDLYYAAVDQTTGSHLFEVELASGVAHEIASLSDGLTRDWALAPDGKQLAFLKVQVAGQQTISQACLLDLTSGSVEPLSEPTVAAFGPVWSASGSLLVSSLDEQHASAALVSIDREQRTPDNEPERGFDVPLAFMPGAQGYIVRSFQDKSTFAPGPSSLTLVDADGDRQTIATGEVTFVGWTNP